MIAALQQDFRHGVFFTQVRIVNMLNGHPVRFGNHLGIFTNYITQRIGRYIGVIEHIDLMAIEIARHALSITN